MSFTTFATALGALAVVVGLLLGSQFLARHFKLPQRLSRTTGDGAGRLAISQSLALDPRRRLVLVRCDGRELLLLTGGPQDISLGWVEPRA